MIYVKPEGPRNAAIMLVGEGPGADEEYYGMPFCGAAGYELSSELRDAGIARSDCFVTNVVRYRPEKNDISLFITGVKRDGESRGFKFHNGMWVAPFVIEHLQHLENEINEVRPNVIVALGNTALWALTGHLGVTKWRGSQMKSKFGPKVVPILHPALILREYSWRAITVQDYKNRVVPESRTPDYDPPKYDFTIRPSFGQVACILGVILSELGAKKNYRVAVDIETRKGQIACLGLATSTRRALCIPFVCLENPSGYWTTDEELWIITKLREIMTHPNVWLVGQNFLYDSQYIINQWKFIPRCTQDTMLWHHTLFPGLQKGLDFLASLYAEFYCYWKDEGKEWHLKVDEEVLWNYNCLDCVYTYEVSERLEESAERLNLRKQVAFQQSQFLPVLGMMLQGIKVDTARRKEYHTQLENSIKAEQSSIDYIVGHPLNTRSGPQMQRLFYTDLKQKQIISRKTGSVTLDSKALDTLSVREPLLRPLIDKIQNIRSMGVFKSTFIEAELDPDNRARCSFNIAGTETFRFSSSTNAFGRGLNLQNIPRVGSDPDVRKMFVPDMDCFIMDWDLDRADLQVVVWEAGDDGLKQALRENVDLHTENAKVLLCARNVAKTWVHGCVTAGHEVLTPKGWIPIEDYQGISDILVWDSSNNKAFFEVPTFVNKDIVDNEDLYQFVGTAYDMETTADHRMPYKVDDSSTWLVTQANSLPPSARLPVSGSYSGDVDLPKAVVQLLVAYQADGYLDDRGRLSFHFKKRRKIKRIQEILDECELQYAVYNGGDGSTIIRVSKQTLPFNKEWKECGDYLLLLSANSLDTFLDELEFWDGSRGATGAVRISTTSEKNAQWISTIAHLRNRGSQLAKPLIRSGRKPLFRVSLNCRTKARLSSMEVTTRKASLVTVFCPKTTTGFFFVRRNGRIAITGNTNYGGSARTMAANCGITVHQSDTMRKRWFAAHPGIFDWHRRVEQSLASHRSVWNAFGYRRMYFDRIEGILPEALAWIPQSTVAIVINTGLVRVFRNLPEIQLLLQVHDSLVMQTNRVHIPSVFPKIRKLLEVTIPYPDPLVIPVSAKGSYVSWGDCEKIKEAA